MILGSTTFYIFNENGFIQHHKLESFYKQFKIKTSIPFTEMEVKSESSVFKTFFSPNLKYTIYNQGYVMFVEGDIRQAIQLLKELDALIDTDTIYFVTPSQRVVNDEATRYPRGSSEKEIAEFLDSQFCNKDYTYSLI